MMDRTTKVISTPIFPHQGFAIIGIVAALSVFFVFLGVVLGMREFLSPVLSRAPGVATLETHNTRIAGIQSPDVISSNKPTSFRQVFVWVQNDGNHDETVGVYLDAIPPGGGLNPGGCVPRDRIIQTTITVHPGQQVKVSADTSQAASRIVDFGCSNYWAVTGQRYTLVAAVDTHSDDLVDCGVGYLASGGCFNALANDDSYPWDNREVKSKPQIQ